MIRSLTLKNFQAWAEVTLPLSPITVIIGETNAGKSSLLRGLACVMFNALDGTGMVRSGASVAEVTVETDDGHTLGWSRGTHLNRYTLDGQLYDKPGRTVPRPIRDALHIQELEFDGEVVRLQWAPQMDAPFLLADSGAKATRMLGVAGNAAIVAQAARLAQQESKGHADGLRAATAQLDALQAQLDTYRDLAVAQPLAYRLRQAVADRAATVQRWQVLHDLSERQRRAAPRLTTARRQQATAQTLVDRMTRWVALRQREALLEAGASLQARHATITTRTAQADRLLAAWRQRHQLAERAHLFAAAEGVLATYRERQDALDRAQQHLDGCRAQHARLVAALTCAACGRVKDIS